MRHLERLARQRPHRLIAHLLISADPILPRMLRLLPIRRPQLADVTLDRLSFECLSFNLPSLERAIFKIKVQRLAVRAQRDDTRLAERLVQWIAGELLLCSGGRSQKERYQQGPEKELLHGCHLEDELCGKSPHREQRPP